jgi:hypothetical protein
MPHTSGTHGSGHRAPARRGRPKPPLPTSRAVAVLVVAPMIGLFLGGAVFVLLCTAAAMAAAVRVRPDALWYVLPTAPLATWTVTVGWKLLAAATDGGARQAVAVARGMIDAFPAMVLALTAAALVAVVRRTSGRGRSIRA